MLQERTSTEANSGLDGTTMTVNNVYLVLMLQERTLKEANSGLDGTMLTVNNVYFLNVAHDGEYISTCIYSVYNITSVLIMCRLLIV